MTFLLAPLFTMCVSIKGCCGYQVSDIFRCQVCRSGCFVLLVCVRFVTLSRGGFQYCVVFAAGACQPARLKRHALLHNALVAQQRLYLDV